MSDQSPFQNQPSQNQPSPSGPPQDYAGVSHPPDTPVKEVKVTHPQTGEEHSVWIPEDHDGSLIRVEFPDGVGGVIEGFDPAEVAIAGGEVVAEAERIASGDQGSGQTETG